MLYTFLYSFVADHYQYLACIGPMALAAAGMRIGLGRVAAGKPVLQPLLCAALLITLGTLTWKQCGMYADDETLWQTTLRRNPNSWLAQGDLGNDFLQEGQVDEAIDHLQKALEINPNVAKVHYSLGLSFVQLGQMDKAIAHFQKALQLKPGFAAAHNNLGFALARKGEVDKAIAEYQKALAIEPDMAEAHENLDIALLQKGEVEEVIPHFQKALETNPDNVEARSYLGLAFAQKGEVRQAIAQFQRILETNPDHLEVCNNLAWLLATASDSSLRNGAKAVALAQHAAGLAGRDNPAILRTLAAAYAETGNYGEAIATARRALELAVKQKNDPLAGRLQTEIKLYEAGAPARDSMAR
jgi:tetratricopeptide (TPR) repeat protein